MRRLANKYEHGIGVIGLISWAIIVVFALLLAIRVIPPYMQYYELKKIMSKMAENPELKTMSKGKIKQLFMNQVNVNSIQGVTPDRLIVENKNNQLVLAIDYEVRKPLIANIDAVYKFQQQAKVE